MQGINFFVFISAVEVEFSLAKLDLEEQAYLLFEQILIRPDLADLKFRK